MHLLPRVQAPTRISAAAAGFLRVWVQGFSSGDAAAQRDMLGARDLQALRDVVMSRESQTHAVWLRVVGRPPPFGLERG